LSAAAIDPAARLPGAPPGSALSKDQLLTQVWGYDAYDSNLVEVHVSALRRKLERARPRMIQTVRGIGYPFAA
jgi:two-component system OmpR family response regulator